MMQALAAIFLLRCLKAKDYYPKSNEDDPKTLSETELFLGKLIHHFMRVTYFNTHEVTTTDEDTTGVGFGSDRLAMRRIGRATNPTLALLNHTCDPNYRRISVGNRVRNSKAFLKGLAGANNWFDGKRKLFSDFGICNEGHQGW